MIYMRVAVELMVMRDFMDIATPMMMEEIRYMIRKQGALIQEPGFEPEQFYHMDAQMHAIWFAATDKRKIWELLQAAAASLYEISDARFCDGDRFYQDHQGTRPVV